MAEDVMARYVAYKQAEPIDSDPVAMLRSGWMRFVSFGLEHPAVFAIMYARPDKPSAARDAGHADLRRRVEAVAASGRLLVSAERAGDLLHATGMGMVVMLLREPAEDRDEVLEIAREMVFARFFAQTLPAKSIGAANTLRSRLAEIDVLSDTERALLGDWLARIATN